jgi:peroxiredoxin Q/BCP
MPPQELREGLKAPTFKLEAASGETIDLSNLGGRWAVLFFYPKASTSG